MKQLSWGLAALLLAQILLSACAGLPAATPTPTVSGPKIRVGVDASLPPFEFEGSAPDEVVGFDVDLIKEIAARAGLQIELVKVGYNTLMPFVVRCDLDAGISAIPAADWAGQPVDFSDPYYSTGLVVLVKQGNITLTGREALAGMQVGTQAGSLGQTILTQDRSIQSLTYDNYYLAVQQLAGGHIDAVLADRPRAQSFVDVKRNDLKIVGDDFGQVDYAIATCRQKPELNKQINAGLAQVKEDGTLEKLARQWKVDLKP